MPAGLHARPDAVVGRTGVRRRDDRSAGNVLAVDRDVVEGVGVDAVAARAALDPVEQAVGDAQLVVAGIAADHVIAQTAVHHVVAAAACQVVVAVAAFDTIGGRAGAQHVGARAAEHGRRHGQVDRRPVLALAQVDPRGRDPVPRAEDLHDQRVPG